MRSLEMDLIEASLLNALVLIAAGRWPVVTCDLSSLCQVCYGYVVQCRMRYERPGKLVDIVHILMRTPVDDFTHQAPPSPGCCLLVFCVVLIMV